MQTDVEGRFDRDGGGMRLDGDPARHHRVHRDSLPGKPGGDGVKVMLRGAELAADLLRGQPLVVLRGGRVLLVEQQLVEGGLHLRRARHAHDQAGRLRVGDLAEVG